MSGPGNSNGDTWRPPPKPTAPKPKGGGEGGSNGGAPDPCDVVETTNLNSVNRSILSGVHVGEVLSVVYQPGPPGRLVAQAPAGIVGSITSPSMPQIIQCIAAGVTYGAEVLAIRGGICQVRIHRQ